MRVVPLNSLEDTKKLAEELAAVARVGDVIALQGDLGAGKSTFARYFITACNPEISEVPSPTFTYVQLYDTPKFPIAHFDLYRVEDPMQLVEIGMQEALDTAVSLIEWPYQVRGVEYPNKLEVTLEVSDSGRRAVIKPDASWQDRVG
ncbi:MAG: tRNA (adenosine(37)-N6)-threonylcarbamoyltransferase complex ATPase subunit type 1 TsaE [Alphaproteobacteria bacterium]